MWSCWRHGPNPIMLDRWHRLKPSKGKSGHLRVTLSHPRKSYYCVHALVLLAFVGPCPDGLECCHFPDRDPTNNQLTNLRYGTRQENHSDAVKHGTAPKGESHGCAKLTEALVRNMRTDRDTGEYSLNQLADKYHVSKKTALLVTSKKIWKHVV